MFDFFGAVGSSPFARNALIVGLLASISCGIVGTYIVTRRITYIAAAISHSALGGLGAAEYLRVVHGWRFMHPIYGALAAAVAAAVLVGWISLRAREREDTVISAVWAIGMAVGILFIYKTPGYNQELMSYLFGNILLVSSANLWLIAVLDVVIIAMVLSFHRKLEAVCFDEEFARLRNIPVDFYYITLLVITALTVVLLITVVGIVMVIALLTLPAAIAGRFTRSLSRMMFLAALLTSLLTVFGLAVSYRPNLPPGPVIILSAGALYMVSVVIPGRMIQNIFRCKNTADSD